MSLSSPNLFLLRCEAPANWTLYDDCIEPHHSHFACGTVTLNSASPWQALLIDPALLNTKFDIVTIREAIKAARRFAASPGWDGYIIGPFGDLATAKTDAELEAYARRNAATFFYPVGTAEMGPRHSSTAVVDPHLVVKGAIGLRVVNASVFVDISP